MIRLTNRTIWILAIATIVVLCLGQPVYADDITPDSSGLTGYGGWATNTANFVDNDRYSYAGDRCVDGHQVDPNFAQNYLDIDLGQSYTIENFTVHNGDTDGQLCSIDLVSGKFYTFKLQYKDNGSYVDFSPSCEISVPVGDDARNYFHTKRTSNDVSAQNINVRYIRLSAGGNRIDSGYGRNNRTGEIEIFGSSNNAPTAPQTPHCENQTTPVTGVTDLTPEFSAIYDDPDTSDTAAYYEIEVDTAQFFTGTGADGSVSISGSQNINTSILGSNRTSNADGIVTTVSSFGSATGGNTLTVASATGFAADDEVLLINLQGDGTNNGNVGNNEFLTIQSISVNTITFTTTIQNIYGATTSNLVLTGQKVILQRVPQWTTVTINSGGTLTANDWDGTSGGVIVFRATGTVTVTGSIDMNQKGYRGAADHSVSPTYQGESYTGLGSQSTAANAGGGGGAVSGSSADDAGGGGGYGTAGAAGDAGAGGAGGGTYGVASLSTIFFGSGGGEAIEGAADKGGDGGGIIYIAANTISVSGNITSNGESPTYSGGGSGGSIYIAGNTLTLGSNLITATGGTGGSWAGGNGGVGRIRIESDSITGTANPSASTAGTPDGTRMWDTGKTVLSPALAENIRSTDVSYAGTALSQDGSTYYWRIRFWDNSDAQGAWSATQQFTMVTNNSPSAPQTPHCEDQTTPVTGVNDTIPEFSAIYDDLDTSDTSSNYQIQVSSNSDFLPAGWWNASWTRRRKLTFNNSSQSENLANFPVLVKLDNTRIDYSQTQNSGQDIRFVDTNGTTVLKHEIEEWNESGTSYVWVKVPQIDGSSSTDYIWMYYGNSGASDGQDASSLWSDYAMVYHFNEESEASSATDSSGNTSGTPSAGISFAQSGQISTSVDLSSGTGINCGSLGSPLLTAAVSMSYWIYSNNVATPARQNPFDQAYGGWGTMTLETGGTINWYMGSNGGNGEPYTEYGSSGGAVTNGSWIHFVAVRNPSGYTYTWYKNGSYLNGSTYSSAYPVINTRTFTIGDGYVNPINGKMDEFRVTSAIRSADWIAAQHKSMTDNSFISSFGTEETGEVDMWDPGKTSMTQINEGQRCADIIYAGSSLSLDESTYYWRIRFWDNSDAQGTWSATQQFTMAPPNATPTAPSLGTRLFDNEKTADTTPDFNFEATDADSDDLEYNIQIDDDEGFGSTAVDADSTTDSGFVNTENGGDTHPFTEDQNIKYTVQSALTNSTTYHWRVRAKDPDGSNTWSGWSSIRSFMVDTSLEFGAAWFQTTDEQFSDDTLTDVVVDTGNDRVKLDTVAGWWNNDWTKRRKITFNNSAQSENLSYFPVLVVLNSSRIDYGEVQDDYDDLRFIDSNGTTVLDYEVEEWNESGTSYVWVEVPQIDGSSSSDSIWIYYGNSSTSTAGEDKNGTWDDGGNDYFSGVWHFQETSDNYTDSSGTGNNSTTVSVTSRSGNGKIGSNAPEFNGTSDYITVSDSTSLDLGSYTIEAWVSVDDIDTWRSITAKGLDGTFNWYVVFAYSNLYNRNGWSGAGEAISSTTYEEDGSWIYVTAIVDESNSQHRLYKNGTEVSYTEQSWGGNSDNNDNNLQIGKNDTWGEYFDGHIDELRISSGVRSDDWLAAQHKSMSDDSFANFESEESSGASSGTITSEVMDFSWVSGASSWGKVYWGDDETNGDIKIKAYYDVSGTPTIIPDGALTGNSSGFDTSPIDISGLSTSTYAKLYLFATLTDSGGTPYLNDWTITIDENATPTAPTGLSPASGGGTTDTTPTLNFTQYDADSGDTVKYRIQIDDTSDFSSLVVDYTSALMADGATSFTVGQAVGTGTYTVGAADQTLSDASYYWRVSSTDNSDASSDWATANSGSVAFIVDNVDPTTTFGSTSESGAGTAYTYPNSQTVYFSEGMSTTATQVTITVTAADTGGSGIAKVNFGAFNDESAEDDTESPYSRTYNITSADSAGTINITSYDNAGNSDASPVSITMTKDTTNPTAGTLSVNESSSYLYVSGANFYYSAAMEATNQTATFSVSGPSDGGAGLQHVTFPEFFGESAVNDSSEAYSEAYLINNSDTSTGSFTCTAVDNVGNSASTNTITVTKDTTNPTITSPTIDESSLYLYYNGTNLYYSDGMSTTEQNANFNGTASDGGAGLNQATFSTAFGDSPSADDSPASWSETYTVVAADTGDQTLTVTVTDKVGNSAQSSITCYEDTTNPTAGTLSVNESSSYLYVSGANFYYSAAMEATNQTATFSVSGPSDGGAGLQHVTFPEFFGESAVNDSSEAYSEAYLINNSDTSTGSFTCTAVDNVGNSASTNTITVTKDTTNPTVTSVACYADTLGDDAAYDDDTTVGLQWAESDGSSGVASVNACIGTTPPNESVGVGAQLDTDTGTEGSNTYYVQVTDNVGNTSTVGSDAITIDLTNPTAPGNLTFNTKTATSVTLNFGAQSTEANFDTYKIFYKQATSGVTESDVEHSDSNLGYINYNTATSTTISDLNTDNYYTFNIWVYDLVGKASSAATEITVFVGACTITSTAIDYDDGVDATSWGEISWVDTETDGSIIYQVEYLSGETWALVPDEDLTGNSTGFGTSPIDISGLNTTTYNQIRLKATFTYSTGTPILSDWTCKWITDATPPVIDSVTITSSKSSWFSHHGVDLGATGGTVYFNSAPAEGEWQNLTVAVSVTEANATSFQGVTAFGDSPSLDTSAPWEQVYSVDQNIDSQSGVVFTFTDIASNTDTATITFEMDNADPTAGTLGWTASGNVISSLENNKVYIDGTTLYYRTHDVGETTTVTLQLSGAADNGSGANPASGLLKYQFPAILGKTAAQALVNHPTATCSYTIDSADSGAGNFYTTTYDKVNNSANTGNITTVYDITMDNNVTSATETGGAEDGVAQDTVSDPAFTWTAPSDANSGVAGYYWYFGTDSAGTPSNWTTSASCDPSAVTTYNRHYLRIKTKDNVGNVSQAATVFTFIYIPSCPPTTDRVTETWYQGDKDVETFDFSQADVGTKFTRFYYKWDRSASYAVTTGDSSDWTATDKSFTPYTSKDIYLHVAPANSSDDLGPQTDLGPYYFVDTERLLNHGQFFDDDGQSQRYGF